MAKNVAIKPLGLVLRKAGLVSSQQVEQALQESLNLPQCRIGEILAIRGWIHPQTADFFAEIWPRVLFGPGKVGFSEDLAESQSRIKSQERWSLATSQQSSIPKSIQGFSAKTVRPLGRYLQAAKLLDPQQIKCILQIQQRDSAKFGKVAVEQGFISQTTLEYFLEHLYLLKTGIEITAYPESTALEIDRIETYLLDNQRCHPIDLLQKYRSIHQQESIVATGDEIEQELLASGIVILKKSNLHIAKSSYRKTFDQEWLEKELANLQPYNQIRFRMFALRDKVDTPYKVTNAINYWCDHQPFLTQKLYLLVQELTDPISPGHEEQTVEELAYCKIIDNWQQGVAAEHFARIGDRIKENEYCSAISLLKTYKKIWHLKEVKYKGETVQQELLRMGLLKLRHGCLRISNRIYQAVLDSQWIERQLAQIASHPVTLQQVTPNTGKGWEFNQPMPNNLGQVTPKVSMEEKSLVVQGHKKKSLLPLIFILLILLAVPLVHKAFSDVSPKSEPVKDAVRSKQ